MSLLFVIVWRKKCSCVLSVSKNCVWGVCVCIHVEREIYLSMCMHAQSFSLAQLFATTWAVAHQASLSIEFSRQEYLSR